MGMSQVSFGVPERPLSVEVIAGNEGDKAFDRLVAGDVRYRFVIDIQTLAGERPVLA